MTQLGVFADVKYVFDVLYLLLVIAFRLN